MSEEVHLVADLALILIAAGVFTIISKALKQPLILGYLLAGLVVGPHLGLFPKLTSMTAVNEWSEIGIVFLLFAVGLEFSFKKILKAGSSALIVAGCLFTGMFTIGFSVGNALGWTTMESIFLGAMMSISSSTTIVIKTYNDLGLKKKSFATLVFGTLVVEDMLSILLLVLLSTLAISNKFSGGEMLTGLAKLLFFLVLSFLVGIYVIPTVLKKAKAYLTDEILLIASIGLCFGMVSLASYVGFSSALGAFLMGSILSESVEGERVEKLVVSIKDLFGAIFFVSVGMMVDPDVIVQNWSTVLLITVIALTGISLIGTTGAVIAGNKLSDSVHTGFSLAQLGEFSFIIAGLGCSLGVLREFIYPVIISVSVITTFTTPYMIKAAGPIHGLLLKKLPERFVARINDSAAKGTSSTAEKGLWQLLLRSFALRVLLYGVVLVALSMASSLILDPFLDRLLPSQPETVKGIISVTVTLAVMAPFLYGLGITGGSVNQYARKLLHENDWNKWPILSLICLRVFIATAFVISVISSHFTLSGWIVLLIILGGFAVFISARFSVKKFTSLEQHFLSNLNEKEELARLRAPVSSSVREKMAGYDVHSEVFIVSPDYTDVGSRLRDLPFRKLTGVNILKISRGSRSITVPSGDERIFPYDRILAVGTSEQLAKFSELLESELRTVQEESLDFDVEAVTLNSESYLCGKTLAEADMRRSGCVVISVLHGDDFITNPQPDLRFAEGDVVWLAGERASISFYVD